MKRFVITCLIFLMSCIVVTDRPAQQYAAIAIQSPTITPTQTLEPTQTLTATSTKTETPTQTPTPTQVDNLYVVKNGDTLSAIAELFGVPLGYLADRNGIKNPDLIYVSQVIVKPPWPPLPDKNRQIIVELGSQQVFVYESEILLKTFLVSTGVYEYPTVTGHYEIYVKLISTTMSGPGYHLENVPYTMYFYKGYGLHGTYWHNNFGHPMSHGCVNMRTEDAEWLFNWANIGTSVWVIV